MSDIYKRINILRAIAQEVHLPNVPAGRRTLSHEVTGILITVHKRNDTSPGYRDEGAFDAGVIYIFTIAG
jgi:hypothetical protein